MIDLYPFETFTANELSSLPSASRKLYDEMLKLQDSIMTLLIILMKIKISRESKANFLPFIF